MLVNQICPCPASCVRQSGDGEGIGERRNGKAEELTFHLSAESKWSNRSNLTQQMSTDSVTNGRISSDNQGGESSSRSNGAREFLMYIAIRL